MARIGTIVVAALLLLPGAALADWSPRKAARVDALVQQFMKPRTGSVTVPGLSISIGIDGALVHAQGDARENGPILIGAMRNGR